MTIHSAVVNTFLSFNEPFTYAELIEKLRSHPEIDWNNNQIQSQSLAKIKEIFECTSIKVVPLSNPTEYYDEHIITIKKRPA